MEKYYTAEKHTQILIALMKFHGIRKIVVSPGTTNICLVGSLQHDPYFELYSSIDERSAAYIACGLARESKEPVALSCTGATASRNYAPGLTEAFYSNLPILAITSTQHPGRIGQLVPQVLDRSNPMNDIAKKSILVDVIHTQEDKWAITVAINDALLELRRHGGGPVHINLVTTYNSDFSTKELPTVRGIHRHFIQDDFPPLDGKKILIYVGEHIRWSDRLTLAVDVFCERYNAVVVCEHISNYRGKYGVYPALYAMQEGIHSPYFGPDVMIHIGNVAGFGVGQNMQPKEVWRVHPDGEVRDPFHRLTNVFEMEEVDFFDIYNHLKRDEDKDISYYEEFHDVCAEIESKVPELPFSNPWIANNTVNRLPAGCEIHLGILNSLRSWSLFSIDPSKKIEIHSNTGGFGIDGLISTLLGSALAAPEKLFLGIIGDLAFFYDMNAAGNRHVPGNMRIMIVNNGRGTEFRNYNHPAAKFGEDADMFMAAYGHYGKQSHDLVCHYAEDLGFTYLTASTKQEYLQNVDEFLNTEHIDKPIIFEVFTDSLDESDALKILYHLETSVKATARSMVKNVIGDKGVETLKKWRDHV
ncbi:MAG: thiamine pyrophosphate-binding protein [Lachnospiraceae bacterium]|nr:thiamine pyrophosphate-binding protein [Lachnospiraceae bacterium]